MENKPHTVTWRKHCTSNRCLETPAAPAGQESSCSTSDCRQTQRSITYKAPHHIPERHLSGPSLKSIHEAKQQSLFFCSTLALGGCELRARGCTFRLTPPGRKSCTWFRILFNISAGSLLAADIFVFMEEPSEITCSFPEMAVAVLWGEACRSSIVRANVFRLMLNLNRAGWQLTEQAQ